MKKSLMKDSLIQIKKTSKRFISMLLMTFMGVGFFAGVRATSPDMKKTMDSYLDSLKTFDLKVVSTLGLTDDDLLSISNIDNIKEVYGIYSEDVFVTLSDIETVVKVIEYNENINSPDLIEGKLPENADECVIDYNMKIAQDLKLGDYIDIKEDLDEDEDPTFINTKLKVVGVVKSPLYISRDRGTTTLGSGKVSYFIYTTNDNIDSDIYTEIDIVAKDVLNFNYISDEYDESIKLIENELEKIKDVRQDARYDELITEANEKLDEAQQEFDEKKADGEKEIRDAEKEIADAKKKIADGERELKEGKETADREIADAEITLGNAQDQIIRNQEALNDQRIYFEAVKKQAEESKIQINAGIALINEKIKDIEETRAQTEKNFDDQINSINNSIADIELQIESSTTTEDIEKLETQKQDLINNREALLDIKVKTLSEIDAGLKEANSQKIGLQNQLNDITKQINDGEYKLNDGQRQLTEAWDQVQSGKAELETKKLEAAEEIRKGEKEIADAKQELVDGEKELADAKIEFDEKITEAEEKLIDAREKINDLKTAKWYILNRNDNTGLNSYSQDSGNVEKLGEVFPIVFFIIATLISLTTMSRMVEEERVQIGTLKALGYSKLQIMSKYILYSLLASIIGGLLGAAFGLKFFPYVIISMYGILYDMPELIIEFNLFYTVLGIGIMTICIVGSTIITANKELKATPAEMMRPKAPIAGKRVLLERIPFIWNRLSFTQKVTTRNMFRYKKRFLMTVVGIMGCTALILAGFGLKDSISQIMEFQYEDIFNYDMLIGLKDTLTEEEISSFVSELENDERIEKITKTHTIAYSIKNKDAQVYIVENKNDLDNVINLRNSKTKEKLELNDDEVIITEKLAQLVDAKVGDTITLLDSDGETFDAKVGGITEHYIQHYVYMTNTLYSKIFNEELLPNVLLATYSNKMEENEEDSFSETLLGNAKVSSVTLSSYLISIMDDTLSTMNVVVYVLIVSAGLLAFIVLYNLANVNISERIRELATIKVLGFYDKEVYNYITREIVFLTIIGIILGIGFGYILNIFILGTCEIDMLRFKRIIEIPSYILASVITIIFTYIVNFITYFSLKKVDMIESLKSVE